jgi:hypothetical protein
MKPILNIKRESKEEGKKGRKWACLHMPTIERAHPSNIGVEINLGELWRPNLSCYR